ncbi:S8 family serine peptidase [archaeon]|mgnify:FL=1|jgi:subtilisin family serine protease|nr:S8 family serine peptidase [archaeon]
MKKLVIILILSMLIFPLVNVNSKANKISYSVMEELENSEIVRVYVRHSGEIDVPGKLFIKENEFSIELNETGLIELEKNYLVESIVEVIKYQPLLDVSVPLINSTPVWETEFEGINLTGLHQTACILDTGVDFTHPDLIGKNKTCVIDCTQTTCIENCSLGDFDSHGTHVAGIIAANGTLKGVAPDAGLIGVKVCLPGASTTCSSDDLERGLEWCIANASQYNITAVSISIGANCDLYPQYCYSSYCNANSLAPDVNDAVSKNISVLISSGNEGNTVNISSPSCIENVTTIAWSTGSGTIATNSNRNSLVDFVAPGTSINSTVLNGLYGEKSGTSMSAPHVTGAFLLMNQMRQLEGNPRLTVQEIQNAFNLTGDLIDDTSNSGVNYSRPDIYSAALYLDFKAPTINLTSPENESILQSSAQTFYCNSSDELQLKNLTIFIWNSTNDLINSSDLNATDNSLNLNFSSNLSEGDYSWACESYDKNENYILSSNYSLTISELYVSLISPENHTSSQTNETPFNCSVLSSKELSNLTFYLWNSTELIYNDSVDISGTSNSSEFYYNFTNEETYDWNCFAENNESESTFGLENYSFIYDKTSPTISLISPANDYSAYAGSVNFEFNLTEENPANCSLIIDDLIVSTNNSITSISNSISYSPSVGTHSWKINCKDYSLLSVNSSSRDIEITQRPSSGGSSGSTTEEEEELVEEEIVNETELLGGIEKTFEEKEIIQFSFNSETHEIIAEKVFEKSVEILIQSDPIRFTLNVGDWKKVNLNNDSYYDLYVELLSIVDQKAEIKIKKINEEIPVYGLFDSQNETGNETGKGEIGEQKKETLKEFLFYGAILILVGFLIYFAIALEKHEKKKSNSE